MFFITGKLSVTSSFFLCVHAHVLSGNLTHIHHLMSCSIKSSCKAENAVTRRLDTEVCLITTEMLKLELTESHFPSNNHYDLFSFADLFVV